MDTLSLINRVAQRFPLNHGISVDQEATDTTVRITMELMIYSRMFTVSLDLRRDASDVDAEVEFVMSQLEETIASCREMCVSKL